MADLDGTTGGRTIGIIIAPTTVRLAQTLGLTLSSFAAGQTLTQSFHTVPSLLLLPAPTLLHEARRLASSNVLPRTFASISILATSWLAYREPSTGTQSFGLYVASAALTSASLLWSALPVGSVERALHARNPTLEHQKWAESGSQLPYTKPEYTGTMGMFRRWYGTSSDLFFPVLRNGQLSVHELVDRWALLNLGVGVLGGVGALVGAYGVASEDTSIFELFQMAAPME